MNNDDVPFNPRPLTRMFSCPSGYEMTEEEHRFDQASNEERANTVWSWTPPEHYAQPTIMERYETITTPPRLSREMTMAAVPMAPPRLSRQETRAAHNLSREMTMAEPPMAPPRLERQETRAAYPPPPVLTRQTATGVSNTNQERPPSRLMRENTLPSRFMCVLPTSSTDEPPSSPPRLIRENAIEPMYRDDLEAQIGDLQRQMVEMREQIAFLLQKIETKE